MSVSIEIGRSIERYVVEGMLGQGGMATVYLLRHRQLGTPHALKVLGSIGPGAEVRLMLEGRVQAALRHPNIVAVTDVLEVDGAPGLLMEYIEPPTLAAWLTEVKPGPVEVERVFRGIVEGVRHAHRHGLVHRDLKPSNVLLARFGGVMVPKVADFGLAKLLSDDPAAGHTRSGLTMGTPQYMAPEQFRDAKKVDQRADIFSLGCILHELSTGTPAFQWTDFIHLYNQISSQDYPRLPTGIPTRFQEVVDACLEPERDRRVPDCEAILAILDGNPVTEGKPRPRSFEPFGVATRATPAAGATIAATGVPLQTLPAVSQTPGVYSSAFDSQASAEAAATQIAPSRSAGLAPPPHTIATETIPPGASHLPGGEPASITTLVGMSVIPGSVLDRPASAPTLVPQPGGHPPPDWVISRPGLRNAALAVLLGGAVLAGVVLATWWGTGNDSTAPVTEAEPPVVATTPVVDGTAVPLPSVATPADAAPDTPEPAAVAEATSAPITTVPPKSSKVSTASRPSTGTAPSEASVATALPLAGAAPVPSTILPSSAPPPVSTPAVAAAPSHATVAVTGDADRVVAVSGSDRVTLPGTLTAGRWEILAWFPDMPSTKAGVITVAAGDQVTVRCTAAFVQCSLR